MKLTITELEKLETISKCFQDKNALKIITMFNVLLFRDISINGVNFFVEVRTNNDNGLDFFEFSLKHKNKVGTIKDLDCNFDIDKDFFYNFIKSKL